MSDFLLPSVLIFGDSGLGKTVAVNRALGPKAYWLCAERNALAPCTDPVLNPHGRLPDFDHCLSTEKPMEEATHCVQKVVPHLQSGKYRAVVIDTLTTLAGREMHRIHTVERIKDDYGKASSALDERIMRLVHTVLAQNAVVVCIAHPREPTTIEGRPKKGGAQLPGKGAISLPQQFDMVLRFKVGMDQDGNKKRVLHVDPLDTLWTTKDRYSVLPRTGRDEEREGPADNLLDYLRAAASKVRQMRGPA